MAPADTMPAHRRSLSGTLSHGGDTNDGHSLEMGGSPAVKLPQGMPLGRSYVAHAAPSPTAWKQSSSWTYDAGDIREGTAQLGNLTLIDAMNARRTSAGLGSPVALPPVSPIGKKRPRETSPGGRKQAKTAPSGLTRMFNTVDAAAPMTARENDSRTPPRPPKKTVNVPVAVSPQSDTTVRAVSASSPPLKAILPVEYTPTASERTPLLSAAAEKRPWTTWLGSWVAEKFRSSPKSHAFGSVTKEASLAPLRYLPATLLGVLMNILDGVSYGLVTFPTLPVFAGFGGVGVSMFFVSCITSQLVTTRRSVFRGGNMMIEVVPFVHSMIFTINAEIGDDLPHRVIATSMVAIALSSVLTGLTFFLLGSLRLGVLLQYFPRHILVGCIGGVGAFLIITGLQVTARLEEDDDMGDTLWQTVQMFFADDLLPLWTIPLGLAISLRLITARFSHPLIFPSFFLVIPCIFYAAIAALGLPVSRLRELGWVFDLGPDTDAPWWHFWTLFDFGDTDTTALLQTLPTQLALVFFAILHVPINVPALALSVGDDNVHTDPELVNHGISNVVAGLIGTVPNYLCYVNSVLFYRVGGDSRLASFMLAVATTLVMMTGTSLIRVLPVMVVGALIYILGIDLMKEAVYDTFGRVNHFEYATIWLIILVMTLQDFVVGIGVGILVACVSFVVSSAKQQAVRFVQSGVSARSTVRRHPQQSKFLKQVGSQIRMLGLEGQIFFGTTSGVESTIRGLFESDMRYLVLDFARVYGIDFSAAEAFLRLHRLCQARALRAVGLWPGADNTEEGFEVFATLNDALEHCENSQLRALYASDLRPPKDVAPLDSSEIAIGPHAGIGIEVVEDLEDPARSPRRTDLLEAAKRTVSSADLPTASLATDLPQPVPLLIQALFPYGEDLIDRPEVFFRAVQHSFDEFRVDEGEIVWRVNDKPNSLFIIQSGILKVSYSIARSSVIMVESMMPATVAGEMTFIADQPRYAEMVAERSCVLWRLTQAAFSKLELDDPARARILRKIFIRNAREQQDAIVGHLIHAL